MDPYTILHNETQKTIEILNEKIYAEKAKHDEIANNENYQQKIKDLCQPGGDIPSQDKIDNFCRLCSTLEASTVGPAILSKLSIRNVQIQQKALNLISALCDVDGCEDYVDYFKTNIKKIKMLVTNPSIKPRADEVISKIENAEEVEYVEEIEEEEEEEELKPTYDLRVNPNSGRNSISKIPDIRRVSQTSATSQNSQNSQHSQSTNSPRPPLTDSQKQDYIYKSICAYNTTIKVYKIYLDTIK